MLVSTNGFVFCPLLGLHTFPGRSCLLLQLQFPLLSTASSVSQMQTQYTIAFWKSLPGYIPQYGTQHGKNKLIFPPLPLHHPASTTKQTKKKLRLFILASLGV